MRIQTLYIAIALLLSPCLYAQKHDYQWIGGSDTASLSFYLDFNSFPPTVGTIPANALMANSAISMSDSVGNLVFYSNGCSLHDITYGFMMGGETINEGTTHDQYCIGGSPYPIYQGIFSLPSGQNKYNLLYRRQEIDVTSSTNGCWTNELLLSQVDMTANQSLGAVTLKDSILLNACVQAPCATRHANGRDWWVLVSSNNVDTFYRFLITPEQVMGPWTQQIDNPTIDSFWYCGWSEFSPDGQRFMINHCRAGIVVYDFDRCTGLLSNSVFLPRVPAWDFAAAFSPNGRLLYTVTDNSYNLIQYDLLAPDIVASKTMVAQWGGYLNNLGQPDQFAYIQHGPDGKLYCWAGHTQFVHVIESPNNKGTACNVQIRAIELPSYSTAVNLYYPNYRLGPIDGSTCDSLGIDNIPVALFRPTWPDSTQAYSVKFVDLSSYEPATWAWSFGDGTVSSDTCPVHVYPASGLYTVCLTVSNANGADTICQDVMVGTVSSVDLPAIPKIDVFPNPFAHKLTIRMAVLLRHLPVYFSMTDALGRNLGYWELSEFETTLSTSHLVDGIYFWHLWVGEHLIQSGKVLK